MLQAVPFISTAFKNDNFISVSEYANRQKYIYLRKKSFFNFISMHIIVIELLDCKKVLHVLKLCFDTAKAQHEGYSRFIEFINLLIYKDQLLKVVHAYS